MHITCRLSGFKLRFFAICQLSESVLGITLSHYHTNFQWNIGTIDRIIVMFVFTEVDQLFSLEVRVMLPVWGHISSVGGSDSSALDGLMNK